MNAPRTRITLFAKGLRTLAAGSLLSSTSALAGIVSIGPFFGVQGSSTIGNISSGGGQSGFSFDNDGGPGSKTASVNLSDVRGSTRGTGSIVFGSNTPTALKADAFLTGTTQDGKPGAIVSTFLFASELFRFTGSSPTTMSVTFTLEGIVSDPAGLFVANNLTVLDSNVAIFADTPNYDFFSGIGTLVFEAGATLKSSGGVDAVDETTLRIDDDTAGATETRMVTLDFELDPGETFYVHQTLAAQAAFGTRSADAYSTLTATFSQPQFVVSVPEPSGSALLLLAGSLLAIRRSRR